MYTYYRDINENVKMDIVKWENKRLKMLEEEYNLMFERITHKYNWFYSAKIVRWNNSDQKRLLCDGYMSMIQIDFFDAQGDPVEVDESVFDFFEIAIHISYRPLRRKYRVFRNEEFFELRQEIDKLIRPLVYGE